MDGCSHIQSTLRTIVNVNRELRHGYIITRLESIQSAASGVRIISGWLSWQKDKKNAE